MPATLGLLLALLTGSAAVGHLVAARQMLRDQTCDFANRWVELTTSGQIEEAFLWTMSVRDRPRREVPAKAFVTSNKTLQQALLETFGKSPLQEMTKRGKPEISYHGVITSYGPNHDRVVVHEYHLEFEKGEPKRLEIAVAVNRQIDADEKVRFVVFEVTNVDDLILR